MSTLDNETNKHDDDSISSVSLLNEQVVDLQTKLQFQDDTIAQLEQVIIRQGHDIVQLERQLNLFHAKFEALQARLLREGGDEPPPHY